MDRLDIPSRLQIRSSLTPHDISVLILIYLHCFTKLDVPARIFVKVIMPFLPQTELNPILKKSFPSYASKKPLIPLLKPLVDYLLETDARDVAVVMVSFLEHMESLDSFTQLLRVLDKECLVDDYRKHRKSKKSANRNITRTSFLGIYLARCLTKYQVGDFQDKGLLWSCFLQYLLNFKKSLTWSNIEKDVIDVTLDSRVQIILPKEDKEMITFFRNFTEETDFKDDSSIFFDTVYFQSILNWQIYDISQNNSRMDPNVSDILRKLSLNDVTRFPVVHIIHYLVAVRDNYYQEALDALHNYFDYIVRQNEENCFHISLLCLATFHMSLHDCPAAIRSFEEATKIARENKDSETLNLIMIWVVDFTEMYPEYANRFQVTVDQIVRYLKSCSDYENSSVFENAYRFEALLLMMDNSKSVLYLESAMKYLVIALQRLQSGCNVSAAFNYLSNLWGLLGIHSISKVYKTMSNIKPDLIDKDIESAFIALEEENYDIVNKALRKLEYPRLKNEQSKLLQLLDIKFQIAMRDYKAAMSKVNGFLTEFRTHGGDAKWKYEFELLKSLIFLSSNLPIRCVPLLEEMINDSSASQNSFQCAQALLLLCQVLLKLGKFQEYKDLLHLNLPIILQFPELDGRLFNLFDRIPL